MRRKRDIHNHAIKSDALASHPQSRNVIQTSQVTHPVDDDFRIQFFGGNLGAFYGSPERAAFEKRKGFLIDPAILQLALLKSSDRQSSISLRFDVAKRIVIRVFVAFRRAAAGKHQKRIAFRIVSAQFNASELRPMLVAVQDQIEPLTLKLMYQVGTVLQYQEWLKFCLTDLTIKRFIPYRDRQGMVM
jgi:hypothetical protein